MLIKRFLKKNTIDLKGVYLEFRSRYEQKLSSVE